MNQADHRTHPDAVGRPAGHSIFSTVPGCCARSSPLLSEHGQKPWSQLLKLLFGGHIDSRRAKLLPCYTTIAFTAARSSLHKHGEPVAAAACRRHARACTVLPPAVQAGPPREARPSFTTVVAWAWSRGRGCADEAWAPRRRPQRRRPSEPCAQLSEFLIRLVTTSFTPHSRTLYCIVRKCC